MVEAWAEFYQLLDNENEPEPAVPLPVNNRPPPVQNGKIKNTYYSYIFYAYVLYQITGIKLFQLITDFFLDVVKLCIICMDREVVVALVPCSHIIINKYLYNISYYI
uniref:Uncharacterized protein n=1 Tax=Schizaphis graminum TaxID=13262 RepID=A0A2S2P5Z7_SCHGA